MTCIEQALQSGQQTAVTTRQALKHSSIAQARTQELHAQIENTLQLQAAMHGHRLTRKSMTARKSRGHVVQATRWSKGGNDAKVERHHTGPHGAV